MPMRDPDATRVLFRSIVAGVALVAPVSVAAVACTATTTNEGTDAASTSDASDAADARPADACHALTPPDAQGCSWQVDLAGDLSTCPPQAGDPANSTNPWAVGCEALCGRDPLWGLCGRSGSVLNCASCDAMGRPHRALDASDAPVGADVAHALARIAYFEAASVDAFDVLSIDLARHGAPRELLADCARVREEEVEHARLAAALATRRGADFVAPRRPDALPVATLEELARDNAIEGCVRESFSALVATWQSQHAATAELRSFFSRIAYDEASHASLAHRLEAWLSERLSADERARVSRARVDAVARVRAELAATPTNETTRWLGRPDATQASLLLDVLWGS